MKRSFENLVGGKGENAGYITSILSFTHNIFQLFPRQILLFKPPLISTSAMHRIFDNFKIMSFVQDLIVNPFPNKPWILRVCSTGLLKTMWEKEKLLVTSNFSFSHSVFHLFGEFSAIIVKFDIAVCKVFQFGTV